LDKLSVLRYCWGSCQFSGTVGAVVSFEVLLGQLSVLRYCWGSCLEGMKRAARNRCHSCGVCADMSVWVPRNEDNSDTFCHACCLRGLPICQHGTLLIQRRNVNRSIRPDFGEYVGISHVVE
jgi:hypothetical protein